MKGRRKKRRKKMKKMKSKCISVITMANSMSVFFMCAPRKQFHVVLYSFILTSRGYIPVISVTHDLLHFPRSNTGTCDLSWST